MMKHNRRFALVLLLIAAVLLTMGLASCQKRKPTPKEYLADVMENTFAANKAFSADLGDRLLTEIIWNGTADTAALGLDTLTLKLYTAPDGQAVEMNADLFDAAVNLKAYSKGTELALQSDLLGDAVYGTDLSKLEDNYKDSLFGDPNSMYYMGDLSEMTSGLPTANVDVEALLTKYATAFTDAIKNNANATMAEREEGGKTVSFVFGNEEIKTVIRFLYDLAKDDTALKELLKTLDTFGPAMGNGSNVVEKEAFGAAVVAEKDTVEDFLPSEDDLNELIAEIDKGSYELTLTVLTTEKDMIETATLALAFTEEDAKGKLELVLDLSKENTSTLSLVIDVKEGEEETPFYWNVALTLEEGEKADGAKTATLTLDMSEDDGMKVSIELMDVTYYEETGAFTLNLLRGVPDVGPIAVKGQLTTAKDAVSLTVTELAVAGSAIKVDIRVAVSTIKSIPAVPAYTEIFSLTESQIENIGETLMNHPLFALLGGE